MNVQQMIFALQKFWSDQGCLIMQAYDVEKGAGTMSPYTFLRAIGPEPWRVAYVEPSRKTGGRKVWGKPEPALPASSVPGVDQTVARSDPGNVLAILDGPRHRPVGT